MWVYNPSTGVSRLQTLSSAVAGLHVGGAILSASVDGPRISDAVPFQFGRSWYGVISNMVRYGRAPVLIPGNISPHSVGSTIGFGINFHQESLYKQFFLIMTVLGI